MINPIKNYISFLGNTVYVIGHKNPDTDSVCSAIAQAKLEDEIKEDQDDKFIPASAGNINAETEFALFYFGIKKPEVIEDLSLSIEDVMKKRPLSEVSISPDATIKELGKLIVEQDYRTLPVINDENEVIGIVSRKDLAEHYLSKVDFLKTLQGKNISYERIAKLLDAEVLTGHLSLNKTIKGKIKVGAYSSETLDQENLKDGIVLTGDREDVQEEAIKGGVRALIITKGLSVSPRIIQMAKENNVIILSTSHGISTSAKLLEQSIPVKDIMTTEVVTLDADSKIDDIKNKVKNSGNAVFPVIKDGKFIGVINREEVLTPKEKELILVDHNNPNQFASGIKKENIRGILDHHKQELLTDSRIPTTYGNVGASATMIAKSYKANSIDIPKEIAGILWCAIVSDTDKFTSATTTREDRKIAQELASIAQIEQPDKLADKLLSQRDVAIENLTPEELVKYDLKSFKMQDGTSYSIGQLTTFCPEKYLQKADEIHGPLNNLDNAQNVGSVLFITDLSTKTSYLLCSKKLQEQAQKALKQDDGTLAKTMIKDTDTSYLEAIGKIANSTEKTPIVKIPKVQSRKLQVEPFIKRIYSF